MSVGLIERPEWAHLVTDEPDVWRWRNGRLFHREAWDRPQEQSSAGWLRRMVVKHVYATQNKTIAARRAVARVLSELGKEDWGLNLGAGETVLHERLLSLDVVNAPGIDIITHGADLPFKNDSLKVVISQEVIEHISDYWKTIHEVWRVLEPGGLFYCQVPFQIGYHPGPADYWRFSRDGLLHLFSDGRWDVDDFGICLGYGSGFYRIAVEYVAVTASLVVPSMYHPTKGLASFVLIPFRWTDVFTERSPQKDRIAAGYFCIARKRAIAG